jgi:nucleotide-binding universal stress UspA family protein
MEVNEMDNNPQATTRERIMVPLDGSPAAEAVLPHASTLALVTRSVLHTVRVVEPYESYRAEHNISQAPERGYAHEAHEAEFRDASDYLASVRRRLDGQGLEIESEVLEGDPALTLVQRAECDPGITMSAMTTHGSSGQGCWPLGSVTKKVLCATGKPLLLVHPEEGIRIPPVHRYHAIVVPLDGSLLAEGALAQARTLARGTGATILLFSVVPSPDDMGLLPSGVHLPVSVSSWQGEVEAISCYLQRIAREVCDRAPGLSVEVRVVAGRPAEAIINISEQTHADLVVMSTHGRGGQTHNWLGSVAMKVVHGANRPVLLVRAPKHPEETGTKEREKEAVGVRTG